MSDDWRSYLNGRVRQVFDTPNRGRPRWTLADATAVRELLREPPREMLYRPSAHPELVSITFRSNLSHERGRVRTTNFVRRIAQKDYFCMGCSVHGAIRAGCPYYATTSNMGRLCAPCVDVSEVVPA